MTTVSIQYFAILREQRGVAEEQLSTSARSVAALYEELQRKHRFTLPASRIRAAVNDEFVRPDTPLKTGDAIVFIPPVAGG